MHTFVRRALRTALVTGGLVVVGAGAAHAAEGDLLGDLGLDVSVEAPLSQVTEALPDIAVDVPVHVPVTVSDVAVGALGCVGRSGPDDHEAACDERCAQRAPNEGVHDRSLSCSKVVAHDGAGSRLPRVARRRTTSGRRDGDLEERRGVLRPRVVDDGGPGREGGGVGAVADRREVAARPGALRAAGGRGRGAEAAVGGDAAG